MRKWITVIISVLISGCMIGPDYLRPKTDVPQAFRNNDANLPKSNNEAGWWKQFQDPVLDALILEGLEKNKSIGIAAANIEQAAAILTQTRSPLFPQGGYSGAAARQRNSESGNPQLYQFIPNPQSSYQTLASASWEIDLWGRIRRLSEAARADLLATEEARSGVAISLVSSIATSYIQLIALDEQLSIARRTLATYREAVKLFELRFKYGQVSQMTVEQARSQYETAAAAVPQLESQLEQTENGLSLLLGRNPGPVQRGKKITELQIPSLPGGVPSDLLANRPDIRQAEQNLIAANARLGVARSLYFPSISLTGAFGYASSDLSDLFKGASRTWSYAGSVTGPIFAGGAIAGQVRQAEAARKAALLNYEMVIQSSFADVENALVSRMKLIDQVHAQEKLVSANSEYARLARLQYEGGYVPYSTVLQAEQQLFPSELDFSRSKASLLISLVTIYKAFGGGWPVQELKSSSAGMNPI